MTQDELHDNDNNNQKYKCPNCDGTNSIPNFGFKTPCHYCNQKGMVTYEEFTNILFQLEIQDDVDDS